MMYMEWWWLMVAFALGFLLCDLLVRTMVALIGLALKNTTLKEAQAKEEALKPIPIRKKDEWRDLGGGV